MELQHSPIFPPSFPALAAVSFPPPPAESGGEALPAAKRAKVVGGAAPGGGGGRKSDVEDNGLTADGFIDMEQETNQLMEGGLGRGVGHGRQ